MFIIEKGDVDELLPKLLRNVLRCNGACVFYFVCISAGSIAHVLQLIAKGRENHALYLFHHQRTKFRKEPGAIILGTCMSRKTAYKHTYAVYG